MNLTRRDALLGATAAAVVTTAITASLAIKAAGVKAALSNQPDLLLVGVQILVNEIRQDLHAGITTASFWALQQAADRLEMLPGVQAISNAHWDVWRGDMGRRFGLKRVLRHVGGLPS